MTERRLKDLLHESVDGLPPVPLADAAWTDAVRRRRRSRIAGTAAAVAAVAVIAGSVSLLGGPDDDGSAPPATQPSNTRSSDPRLPNSTDAASTGTEPDGRHGDWRVYWGPADKQEARLPRVDSPLPRQVDLSADATDLADDPIDTALAAYAVMDGSGLRTVLLLAPDGSLRRVDVSRVQPLVDDSGNVIAAGTNMLSPKGDHLQFPQNDSVLMLTLATGEWRTIEVGEAVTEHATWVGDDLHLPSTVGGAGPLYGVDGQRTGASRRGLPTAPPGDDVTPYGLARSGPKGVAQSWSGADGLPVADHEVTPSEVMVVQGFDESDSALLVFGSKAFANLGGERNKECCPVKFWLDDDWVVYEAQDGSPRLIAWQVGTHDFRRVSELTGLKPDQEYAVSSYSRIWS
ncbi:hypothetical protein [Nocardioides sp. Soil796]|uniref:hypothetical protein n=1 Tax=Nocardioides sp. Soil796 TaxID=1736412 RepID=UPI00070E2615|nr:hypothetical protein [Nocardioides sp. Soil796]KRF14539.1 hypothetical protein ASH02_09445 [Nocardioides sp. Soil796]